MNVHVFVGPTLSRDEVLAELAGATILEPVAVGDVYRAVKSGAGAIAIIDGYFERVPAVWHKEILWAMSQRVHVFGASSMGALRAAELASFGMVGIGEIYESYRTGILEDDDEVTIVHASAADGFAAQSEAMVNIRATVEAAITAGVVSPPTAKALLKAAKSLFYAERSYPAAIAGARKVHAAGGELLAFRDWLPSGRVDAKADDGRKLLRHLKGWLANAPKPMRASFRFEATDTWLEAVRQAEETERIIPDIDVSLASLEDELKLAGAYRAARADSIGRTFAIQYAQRAGFSPDRAAVTHAAELVRQELGLIEKTEFDDWLAHQRLQPDELFRLFEDQARVFWGSPVVDEEARGHLVDALRLNGDYAKFLERAERKARVLDASGTTEPSLNDLGVAESELWRWYFLDKLGQEVPLDLERWARRAGFVDKDQMRSLVLRDMYCHRNGHLFHKE